MKRLAFEVLETLLVAKRKHLDTSFQDPLLGINTARHRTRLQKKGKNLQGWKIEWSENPLLRIRQFKTSRMLEIHCDSLVSRSQRPIALLFSKTKQVTFGSITFF
jgi:hypothetical protein